jgi:polyferredoxin
MKRNEKKRKEKKRKEKKRKEKKRKSNKGSYFEQEKQTETQRNTYLFESILEASSSINRCNRCVDCCIPSSSSLSSSLILLEYTSNHARSLPSLSAVRGIFGALGITKRID